MSCTSPPPTYPQRLHSNALLLQSPRLAVLHQGRAGYRNELFVPASPYVADPEKACHRRVQVLFIKKHDVAAKTSAEPEACLQQPEP